MAGSFPEGLDARGPEPKRWRPALPSPALVGHRAGCRGAGGRGGAPGLVGHADQGAGPGLLPLPGAAGARHRRAGRPHHRGARQDQSEADAEVAQGDRADRVRLLAAADRDRRGAGGEPGRGMPDRPASGRRRRVHRAVQLPQHGAALDHPERDRAGQLHDAEAVRAGAAQRGPDRGAAGARRGCRPACSAWSTAAARWSRRSAIIRGSRPSASSDPPGWRKLVYRRGTVQPQAGAGPGRRQEPPARAARRRPGDDVHATSSPPCPAAPDSAAWRPR